ncbi:MAG: 50S ribosomal protein L3 [Verrucomicrobiae bacterium]|nr:50S ribosomal protein L3 [Verrucomicrobiae bacterium]
MSFTLLGKKIGMTRVYDVRGDALPVTVVEAGPCVVLQKKTAETDGYASYQLGFNPMKESRATMQQIGHAKKAKSAPMYFIREVPSIEGKELNPGDQVTVNEFQAGQYVDVIGTSKGKGFQGVVFRHKFGGGPATHGCKGWKRRGGAIGQRSFPGHVNKGMKMPGQMGNERCTVQNLEVIQVRETDNALLIRGAIPGPNGGYVIVRPAKKILELNVRKPLEMASPTARADKKAAGDKKAPAKKK